MKAIINTKLVMTDGIIWDGALTFENGKIIQADWAEKVNIPADAEIIDAKGLYTAPGLIDIHNHGGGDWLFAENPLYCAKYFLKHGETTILPTFYHNLDMNMMLEGAAKVKEASKSGAGKAMDGLYMEGPFMCLEGSFQNEMKWSGAVKEEEFTQLVDGLGDMVRVWAIDPDRENIEAFLKYAREKTPDVIFAHGHSSSTSEAIRALAHYGIKVKTHITDAGQSKGRAQGTPGAGGDQYCLYEPDMYAELICDENGIHCPPDLIKMIVRTKGVEKVCLISDSMPSRTNYKNNEAMGIWWGPDLNYDDEGKLAGSRMTLENGVRNMMTHTGYGLCHAIRMATYNPAKLLGIENRVGSLAPGKTANLIIIDDMVHINQVYLEGELAVEGGEVII
ncbi:MAG: amidohydrolase family protein [Eubacteriales bacterium]|nr:amidohydrolase family protein [Eubacteriales bacterium]